MGYSGAQMKAAQQFRQRFSKPTIRQRISDNHEFSNYYNRLAALAHKGGQQAVQATGNQGRNMPKTRVIR